MFSVQFMAPTSQFIPCESNGLVYKPHPRFLARNLSKKVRLIHKSLRYLTNTYQETSKRGGKEEREQESAKVCWHTAQMIH